MCRPSPIIINNKNNASVINITLITIGIIMNITNVRNIISATTTSIIFIIFIFILITIPTLAAPVLPERQRTPCGPWRPHAARLRPAPRHSHFRPGGAWAAGPSSGAPGRPLPGSGSGCHQQQHPHRYRPGDSLELGQAGQAETRMWERPLHNINSEKLRPCNVNMHYQKLRSKEISTLAATSVK